ncbi:MAG TPA: YraN family protein [Steroidobacter sp.]|jgi:putative endonuclease|nr:YraN family protein [Steroidobacteraceae bacterium]HLS79899.1 YraN family protein [Steroidobacter sp.]
MDDRARKDAGRRGEQLALDHLLAHGLQLIVRNYRCKAGEVDLVMLDRGVLALIEVRYRATSDFGGAAASVTWRKQQRLIRASQHLLMRRPDLSRYPARFDVVAITAGAHEPQIDWIKSAFTT